MASTILVVEGDVTAQRRLREILEQAGYRVVTAADGLDGLRLLAMESPALVVLDVALPTTDGYQVVSRIRGEEGRSRHVPVIMLTAERDVEQKIRALRAGADDYLVRPTDPTFHPAELLARARSLLARHAQPVTTPARPPLGRVVTLYGAKGGVGTTTIAINTAISIARDGRSVCLVDGNLQFGDLRVFLDLGHDAKSISDVISAPSLDSEVVRRVLARHESGIELLLAPPTPEAADLIRPDQLGTILGILRGMFDFVFVDANVSLDDTTLGIIEASDEVHLVITADLSCLKNVRLLLQTLNHIGFDASRVRLVLSRSTAVTGISVKGAEGALGRQVDFRVVNDYRTAISALNSGAPFQSFKPESALGRSIQEYAKGIQQAAAAAAPAAPERTATKPAFLRR